MITYVNRSLIGSFHTFEQVEDLSSDAFEYFSALMLEDLGYEHVRVSQKFGNYKSDGGIDLYAEHNGNMVVAQCKRHSVKSGRFGYIKFEYVQALGGAMLKAKAPEGVFVSTLPFSKTSKKYAEAVNMHLIGPDEIKEFVEKNAEKLKSEELEGALDNHPKLSVKGFIHLLIWLLGGCLFLIWLL